MSEQHFTDEILRNALEQSSKCDRLLSLHQAQEVECGPLREASRSLEQVSSTLYNRNCDLSLETALSVVREWTSSVQLIAKAEWELEEVLHWRSARDCDGAEVQIRREVYSLSVLLPESRGRPLGRAQLVT